ncbi:MAG: DISARM anti-phage system protein DrmE domain-containing protein [Promethearchaeota archaeon]
MRNNENIKWYNEIDLRMSIANDRSIYSHKNLSPLSNFTLNIIYKLFKMKELEQKNLIVAFPSNIFKPLSLIAYIYSRLSKKDVLIITSKENYVFHNENYYQLTEGDFVFIRIPIGILKNDKFIIELNMPDARSSIRKEYEKYKENLFKMKEKSRIFFSLNPNDSKIIDSINKLVINKQSVEKHIPIHIGLIIFENFNNFFSIVKYNIFKEWICNQDLDLKFIFFFSNPISPLIPYVKNDFDCLSLLYNISFLKYDFIYKKAIPFYKSEEYISKFSERYNLDSRYIYDDLNHEIKYEVKYLENGNIDDYKNQFLNIMDQIELDNINDHLKYALLVLKRELYNLYNYFIIPRSLKIRFFIEDNWKMISLLELLELIYKLSENSEYANEIINLIKYFNSIYLELSECKRFNEQKSYTRITKNYALLNYISNKKHIKKLIIVDPIEKNILINQIELVNRRENIIYLDNIKFLTSKKIYKIPKDELKNYELIFSGDISSSDLLYLYRPWKKIIFFVYKGFNEKVLKYKLNLLNKANIKDQEVSIRELEKISKYFGYSKDTIIESFYRKKSQVKVETSSKKSNKTKEDTEIDISQIIYQEFKKDPEIDDIEETKKSCNTLIKHYEQSLINNNEANYELKLKEINTDKVGYKYLPATTSYLCFEDINKIKIESLFPYAMKRGNFIIIISPEDRKLLIEDVSIISKLNEKINFDIIKKWQNIISSYFIDNYKKNSLRIKDFYNDYCKICETPVTIVTFRNWINGKVSYTRDPKNLYYLGELMKENFLIDEYQEIFNEGKKLQKIHKIISEKLKKIIQKILQGSLKLENMSMYEYEIYKAIENNIYEIISIRSLS